MKKSYRCKTSTGSTYHLYRDEDGGMWLRGKNIPNELSESLDPKAIYPVALASTWPPKVDTRLAIYRRFVSGEPLLPQNLYVTSQVLSIQEVSWQ